jgi:D-proline reductase (dithiol) PrdB
VLARTLEAAGLSTILITPMPFWAERIGVPRTLAVEFPFGHALGQPGNSEQQHRVIEQALQVLETVTEPGAIVHSPERWSGDTQQALEEWQPETPSPVVRIAGRQIRQTLRDARRRKPPDAS